MRFKLFVIAGIMGLAVVSGIMKSLSSPRGGTKENEGAEPDEKSCGADKKQISET